jgi:hypothetical protein
MRIQNDTGIEGTFAAGYSREVRKSPSLVSNPYSFIVQLAEYLTYMGPFQNKINTWFNKTPIKPYWSYIHWNEKEVLSTIQNEYSWENWLGIESTWRGDCYIVSVQKSPFSAIS